jgi:hypothetical protein
MTQDTQHPHGGHDNDDLTRALRAVLAPPGGDAYWDAFARRITAHVVSRAHVEVGPWSVLAAWTRPAMIAAAAAVLICTAAVLHTRQAEARVAYESLLASPPGAAPAETAIRPALVGERDVTLGLLIAH